MCQSLQGLTDLLRCTGECTELLGKPCKQIRLRFLLADGLRNACRLSCWPGRRLLLGRGRDIIQLDACRPTGDRRLLLSARLGGAKVDIDWVRVADGIGICY